MGTTGAAGDGTIPGMSRFARPTVTSRRRLFGAALATVVLLAGCATTTQYSSGRLARVSPSDFIEIPADAIAVGVDLDSRVPATPNRGPELLVAVMPVDHEAWEPIGARLRMRPVNLGPERVDRAAGEALRGWMEPPGGRIRLVYVLTDESREELGRVQRDFASLLDRFPPGSGKPGALRIAADTRFLIDADPRAAATTMQTVLQLTVAEGPFTLWEGRIDELR